MIGAKMCKQRFFYAERLSGQVTLVKMLRLLGWVAEWLCSGLQIRGRRFDSDPSLQSDNLLYDA